MEEQKKAKQQQPLRLNFWKWTITSITFRLLVIYFSQNLNFATRAEISTPLTSLRRLSEGYWLKQSSISPYAGSMYHGSPLLLSVLGPLTVKKIAGLHTHLVCSLVSVVADLLSAMLIRALGSHLQIAFTKSSKSVELGVKESEILPSGDIAALVYLWNPFTIVTCVGFNTTPIENLFIILLIYGACARLVPLAAFGWAIASHLSLYPAILIIPAILLLGYGPDSPPRKLLRGKNSQKARDQRPSDGFVEQKGVTEQPSKSTSFLWRPVFFFILWTSIWTSYVLLLCSITMKDHGGLSEMIHKTYGFILTVRDLSPNIGVLWYFFAEVFDFFRGFFLIVFHVNILFMVLPLAIRLNHRPCFLAVVYVAISSILKSYPSVGDSALYLGLLALFTNELVEMHFSFFLFCGYVGVSLLSPVMHNLWIWRGTGNANFYFATAIAYACFQIALVVECVSAMLNHDRKIRKHRTLTKA